MKVKKNNPKLAVNIVMQEPRDRERNYSPGEQNIITKKANSIVAKANWQRQKQIRNGKSKFVTAKVNWKWQKQICYGN